MGIVLKYLLPNCGQYSFYSINLNHTELTIEVIEGGINVCKAIICLVCIF